MKWKRLSMSVLMEAKLNNLLKNFSAAYPKSGAGWSRSINYPWPFTTPTVIGYEWYIVFELVQRKPKLYTCVDIKCCFPSWFLLFFCVSQIMLANAKYDVWFLALLSGYVFVLCIFLNTQWIIFNFSRKSFHFLVWLKKKKQTKNGNSRLWIPILQSNGNPWETDCGCIERSLLLHFSSRCHMRAVNRFGWLASVTPPQPGQPRLS